jgi:hypothetical protein
MTGTSMILQDQIALAEQRVRLEKLHLKVAAQGLRSSALTIVSGPIGLAALFLAAGLAGALAERKLTKR